MAEIKRILVTSDTHGSLSVFSRVLKNVGDFDRLIHCGDFLYHGPRNNLPVDYSPGELAKVFRGLKDKILGVRGNCDAKVDLMIMGFKNLPEEFSFSAGKIDFLIAHGDEPYSQKIAKGLVVSGHTHVASLERKGNLVFLNPGSPSIPKDESGGTYSLIEISGKTRISIHKIDGSVITELFF